MRVTEWRCPETKEYYDAVVSTTSVNYKIAQLKQLANSNPCCINEYPTYFEIPLNGLEEEDINLYPKWLHSKLLESLNQAELYIIKVVK